MSGLEKLPPSAPNVEKEAERMFCGIQIWLFESQGATGESGKVR